MISLRTSDIYVLRTEAKDILRVWLDHHYYSKWSTWCFFCQTSYRSKKNRSRGISKRNLHGGKKSIGPRRELRWASGKKGGLFSHCRNRIMTHFHSSVLMQHGNANSALGRFRICTMFLVCPSYFDWGDRTSYWGDCGGKKLISMDKIISTHCEVHWASFHHKHGFTWRVEFVESI